MEQIFSEKLETINKYVAENNITIPETINKHSKKLPLLDSNDSESKNISTKVKEDTRIVSYNLYKKGKSINEICEIRGLKRQTVEGHLVKCFELGMDIDMSNDVQAQFESMIYQAIYKLGFEKLRPLKDYLPDDVSYLDINYFVAKYKKENIS